MGPIATHHSAKGTHYHNRLGAALVRGAWNDAQPGTTPSGGGLPWNELIRKWGKHTGGNQDIVQHLRYVSSVDLNSANHVRAAATQVGSSASSGDGRSHETGASGSASSYVHIPAASGPAAAPSSPNGAAGTHSRSPSASASGPPYRRTEPNSDGDDGASGNAWVRGANWGRVLDPTHCDKVRAGARSLEDILSSSALAQKDRSSATLTLAYHYHALADHDRALRLYEHFDWSASPTLGVVEGDAAVVERVRGRVFQGISIELSHPADGDRALLCYLDAVALLARLSTSPMTTPSYLQPANAKPSPPDFESQREVHRHVSTALTRAAVIAARSPDTHLTLRVLRTYHAVSAAWLGSKFRANQRQRMMTLYLAALQSSYPAAGAVIPDPYLLACTSGPSAKSARAIWHAEVVEAMRIGQRMLADTTSFPRAGDINTAVTVFTDQVSVFPDLSPMLAGDVIDVLWWGTTLTFQSQSLLRHLVRLLALSASRDRIEARRTFELYVRLVLKARQTQDPESPLKLERRPTATEEDQEEAEDVVPEDADRAELETGMDSDEDFISTLLVGTELLLSAFDDSEEAWRYATLAGEVVKHGRNVNSKLAAKVEECLGVVRLTMSTSVAGPKKRPQYETQAINHLRTSTTIDSSSPAAFYRLAYAHATARNVEQGLDAVRSALELEPHNIPAWHLLALLLTAQGKWEAASKAGETGIALWEADDDAITADESDTAGDAEASPSGYTHLLLPSGEVASTVTNQTPRPSRSARLETVIQLRMTVNVIAEKLHGPEFALERHQQTFSFFSQRTDTRESRAAPSEPGSGHSNPPADLGDSYVLTKPADVHVSPPSPELSSVQLSAAADRTRSPPVATTPSSAGDSSAPHSDVEGGERRVTIARSITSRGHSKKALLLPKHLHVPSVARGHLRVTSAHQAQLGLQQPRSRSASSPALGDGYQRSRAASQSTFAASIAPTVVHSHYRGARGSSIPAPPPPVLNRRARRPPAEQRILSDLWLMSAASFRRACKYGQALVAVEEAETYDPENPSVWVQLGLLQLAEHGAAAGGADATKAFTKAMLLRPDHPPAVVCMARLYLAQGDADLAHSLLWQLTEDRGWDVPEAWLSLATACEKQGRAPRARECLLEALRLEKSRPCRALGDALRQW